MRNSELNSLVEPSIALVRRWLDATVDDNGKRSRSPGERRLAQLLKSPQGLDFAVKFVDRVVRSEDRRIAARELFALSSSIPSTLSAFDRLTIRLGGLLAPLFGFVVIPIARARMRQLVGHLVADARPRLLAKHIANANKDGHALNLNLLGEAVLGENEAGARFDRTFELLRRPEVDYVSIKLSSVASQLSMWGYNETIERLVNRLMPMYEFAVESNPPKFINLDMEEYRDLHLTIDVFKRIMSNPKLLGLSAGIVVQCYLPDSAKATQELWAFAATRVQQGGAPLKVRVVKGANLAMERVDAEWHGWQLATYATKAETDANYKRVLEWLLDREHLKSLKVGIAGHNLFDIALAHNLMQKRGITTGAEFEMLKGMASDISEVIRADIGSPLLYTPVVRPKEFRVAIAYLIRRLEENASSENFMSGLFDIAANPEVFDREANRFRRSVELVDSEPQLPRRLDPIVRVGRASIAGGFVNEPDTDPSMPASRGAVALAIARGTSITRWPKPIEQGIDKLTSSEQIHDLLVVARQANHSWARDDIERKRILLAAADELAESRNELLTLMVAEAGKTATEADPELSEAIDFARFYAKSIDGLRRLDGTRFVPNQVTVVVPPWNFPVAIPAGGVLAALAAGSSVILKPAPQVPGCSLAMVQALWRAGVPREVLQIVSVEDGPMGLELVGNEMVDSVVLTGAFDTAKLFVHHKPGLKLAAETSGKNSMIITPSADLDLAAADLAKSAFGHAGQKCSAASVAILVGSVRKSEAFKNQLLDAVQSMKIGRDASSTIGPLIEPPTGKLLKALTELDSGESWLLQPRQLDEHGQTWSPGIRVGVKPGAWIQTTEVFGPVLAIVHAKNLKQAIRIQNSTDFGLTAGLHSLDQREQAIWRKTVQAGNLYINRTMTGAIVERQPFGGHKRSSVGWGLKAGGLNYLFNFGRWVDELKHYRDDDWLEAARLSDNRWLVERFGFGLSKTDTGTLRSEANIKRYLPAEVLVLIGEEVTQQDKRLLRIRAFIDRANAINGESMNVKFSRGNDRNSRVLQNPSPGLRVIVVGDPKFDLSGLQSNPDVTIFDNPVVVDGLITGLLLMREQSISITTHRYGDTFTIG